MGGVQECIEKIVSSIGASKVSLDKATRICHRVTHGAEALLHEDLGVFTPAAVVRPKCTEDVVQIVNYANEYHVPLVPQGGRTGSSGAEGMLDCIVIDTLSMNKILDFDEKAYRITGEAGVRITDIVEYLSKRGYLWLDLPAMNRASSLGSRAALGGYTMLINRWGSGKEQIRGLEVVLGNGSVLETGRGSRVQAKSGMGFDLQSIIIGSKGSLGIITKVTDRFISIPPAHVYDSMAFSCIEDAFSAYEELFSPIHAGVIWRTKGYSKKSMDSVLRHTLDQRWPEDVEHMVDYHLFGEEDIVQLMHEKVRNILKKHNGFWRDDLPPTSFLGEVHDSMEKFMGLGAVGSPLITNKGEGYRILPMDPVLPNKNMLEFYPEWFALHRRLEDGKSYPELSKRMHIVTPGDWNTAEEGWTKVWTVLTVDVRNFNQQTRKEFKSWFSDLAEIVWNYGGTLTETHGFIPRDMEVSFIKREMGEEGYELMKRIKHAFDPNNIMNPKARF